MKVTKKKVIEAFKPVTLEVVFETQEEVTAFRECAGYDCTIPHSIALAGEPRSSAEKFMGIVESISNGLKDA